MSNRLILLALAGSLALSLAGCGDNPAPAPTESKPEASAAPPPAAKPVQIYELTKDDITTHPDWTSANISILGGKIGDKTNDVIKNFGETENTRTLPEEYLTVHQKNGLFVYTFKLTGKIRKFEVYDIEPLASKIKDENFKTLLKNGDLKFLHDKFGMEEKVEDNAEDMSTEYAYDAKGFRFVKYKVGGKTVNALRFFEVKKPGTT
jgi:hypothetical protein